MDRHRRTQSQSRRRRRRAHRRRFRHHQSSRAVGAAGSDRRDHRHRRASARRSDAGGGRARRADADRKAARHRSRAIRPRAQSDHRRQARRGGRLYPALPAQMARRQGEGAQRRARRRHHGDLARLHESAGRHRQLQAHRRSGDDLADGDFRHARARHRDVVSGRQDSRSNATRARSTRCWGRFTTASTPPPA